MGRITVVLLTVPNALAHYGIVHAQCVTQHLVPHQSIYLTTLRQVANVEHVIITTSTLPNRIMCAATNRSA
jgi:uncharacterized membrane-anchored protein YitT (DUF2179 family)